LVPFLFIWIRSQDARLCRFYEGKLFVMLGMAKDAEVEILGTSSIQSHADWIPQAKACSISGTNSFRWSLLVNIVVDLTLLCIMFAGVLQKKNATHLWRMLYFQSIFWILTATATEVPSVVSHLHNFLELSFML